MAGILRSLLKYGKSLRKVDTLVKVGEDTSHLWDDAARVYRNSADEVAGVVFDRSIGIKVVSDADGTAKRLKVLSKTGKELDQSATDIANTLTSGNLARAAKLLDSTLNVPERVVKEFDTLARNTPIGAFSHELAGISQINKELAQLPLTFSRRVSDEVDFLRKIAQANQTQRLTKLESLMKSGKRFGGLILVGGGGITAYVLLKRYARDASGCYRTIKIAGNVSKCKVIQYSKSQSSDGVSYCTGIHTPKDDKDLEMTEQGCAVCCDDDKLMGISESTHYECVTMDVWDALGDITGRVLQDAGQGTGHSIVASGILKYIAIGGTILIVVFIGGRYAFRRWRTSRKRKYEELINEDDDDDE